MLLTLTTTHEPATDLGYLLHKNPGRMQTEELSFGKADVFYPEADQQRCTAAVLLEVDPVGLVRGRRGPAGEVPSNPLAMLVTAKDHCFHRSCPIAIPNLLLFYRGSGQVNRSIRRSQSNGRPRAQALLQQCARKSAPAPNGFDSPSGFPSNLDTRTAPTR